MILQDLVYMVKICITRVITKKCIFKQCLKCDYSLNLTHCRMVLLVFRKFVHRLALSLKAH